MDRTIARIKLDQQKVRIRVTISGDPCEPKSPEGVVHQYMLLHHLVDSPHLMKCDFVPFEKLTVLHNGRAWVAELEAVTVIGDSVGLAPRP